MLVIPILLCFQDNNFYIYSRPCDFGATTMNIRNQKIGTAFIIKDLYIYKFFVR
jgi:hypothetical protein